LKLSQIRRTTQEHLTTLDNARAAVKREEAELKDAERLQESALEAQQIAQEVAKGVQEQAHHQLAGIVSRCLETVFDEPYEFQIEFQRKRGRTEARLYFTRDDVEVDPMTASGGGVVDVAAFALRLSCLCMSQPPLRRVMVLDEPFKFLSEEYRERVRDLLLALAVDFGVQFIMVTHVEEFKIGKVKELG
jgi:DNA repair exonuclease SbcCD ATPase subunit